MALTAGTKLGPYEILSPIGAGGMGEVYRARDTKLKRDVALKVLPATFGDDPERMARFEREAQVLASLNHPNIAQIYGVEGNALIMELVEGPTLGDRMTAGPLALDEALAIARQMTDALEAAHERNIVHRDLKPANVKVTPEGQVKVLDFGLAKAAEEERPGGTENSPTLTMRQTQMGVILGTAGYMAPEQARGKKVDKRADIWAFGVVVWEMLAGKRLFAGEDVSHTLAAVIMKEPEWGAIPVRAQRLLKSCLEKDPKKRLRDIGDVWRLLDEAPAAAVATVAMTAPSRSRLGIGMSAMAGVLAVAFGILGLVHFREPALEPAAVRFQVELPPKVRLAYPTTMALSPDSRRLAFVAGIEGGESMIWLRNLDALEAHPVPGTEGAGNALFWSPDGRFLGFRAEDKLKKVDLAGGPAQALTSVNFAGGSWSRNGVILIGSTQTGLRKVPEAGGALSPVTEVDHAAGELVHLRPHFLPDGRHFVYYLGAVSQEKSGIYMGSLDGGVKRRLVAATAEADYVPPAAGQTVGHLVFLRETTLMALPLDARGFEPAGEPFPVADSVGFNLNNAFFSVSSTGALAYRQGVLQGGRQLSWLDRQGQPLGTVGAPGSYDDVAISPDGKRLAVSRTEATGIDIWVIDLVRGVPTKFTFNGASRRPIWSPDGSRIYFTARMGGDFAAIYQKASDGSGSEERVVTDAGYPWDVSPDGQNLLYGKQSAGSSGGLWLAALTGERKSVSYLRTPFQELFGQFAPVPSTPQWVAYTESEGGRVAVFAQTLPLGAGKHQISSDIGAFPKWRRDGKELFYIGFNRSGTARARLLSVDVTLGSRFEAGIPKPLFDISLPATVMNATPAVYDVTADGKRFLIIQPVASDEQVEKPITVVLNWLAGVKR